MRWKLLDVLVAVVLAIGAGGNLAAGAWSLPPWLPGWLGWTILIAGIAPLALRRIWPLSSYLAGLVIVAAAIPIGGPVMAFTVFSAACALYIVTSYGDNRVARVGIAAGLLEIGVFAVTVPNPSTVTTLNVGGAALMVSFGLAHLLRFRREHAVWLRENHAQQAVSEERLRIAREMHDVVAHSMSLIAVKAAVGNHVAVDHPEEARDALRVIEDTSRETLAELRRMLGVLRTGDTETALTPAPTLAELRALAERTGQVVDLTVDGLDELPGGVGQSVYRIAQEALTNVVKHAQATRVTIRVAGSDGEVSVEVLDDGLGATDFTPGHGLIGMRERVAVYGGEFSAGPVPDGFRVFARLPYEDAR